ncbi:phosphoenolpyruvate--protein phosphotransferase, partial [Candidatus Aerophobetes bacterium]
MPEGIAASPGIAIGRAYVLEKEKFSILEYQIKKEEVEKEIERFKEAVRQSKKELEKIKERVRKKIGEKEAYIFQAHLYMLEDPFLIDETIKRIRRERLNAEAALRETFRTIPKKFASDQVNYIQERLRDVRDVGGRVLRNLLKKPGLTLSHLNEEIILVAHDLAPSDTASLR